MTYDYGTPEYHREFLKELEDDVRDNNRLLKEDEASVEYARKEVWNSKVRLAESIIRANHYKKEHNL